MKERKLTGFRMVPLNDRQVLAIIVTDKGNVENQVFAILPLFLAKILKNDTNHQ